MTHLDDFDRAIGDFLRDGPTVAPEPPVIAAMAHARTTPRRRDPFAALRRDVMARPWRIGGLRPGLILAAAALVLVAVGLAVFGAGRNQETLPTPSVPVVAPSASASPSPAPAETPHLSIAPSISPSPLPRITTLPPLGAPSVTPIHVKLAQCCGDQLGVDVVDESRHLLGAVSGPNVEGGSVDQVVAANDDPTTVRVTWPGSPCDTIHRLTIDPTLTSITIDRPNCAGDAVPADRIVILTFDQPVSATALDRELVTGRGGVDMPSWTATGIDKAGGIYHLSLFDQSQTILSVEPADVTEIADFDPTNRQRDQIGPDTIRQLWYGLPCRANPTLTVDSSGLDWQLDDGSSTSCDTPALRGIDVTFTGPLALERLR